MKTEKQYFQAGLFVTIGSILVGFTIWVLGQERQVFAPKANYYALFTATNGLSEGAPVRLGGITIGEVSDVAFSKSASDPKIRVDMELSKEFSDRIREDSVASLKTQGLLGDLIVTIKPGTIGASIPPEAQIPSTEGDGMAASLSKATSVVDDVKELSKELKAAAEDLRTGTLKHTAETAESLAQIAKEIESGDGLLHKLIYKESSKKDDGSTVESILESVNDIVTEVKEGDGLLHALIYEPEGKVLLRNLSNSAKSLSDTAKDISAMTQEIKDGNGLAHDIIYGDAPEGLQEVVAKMVKTAGNLEAASKALSSGTGTLGALIIDPSLYENLVEVTDEAKRSFLLRQAIKTSLNQ